MSDDAILVAALAGDEMAQAELEPRFGAKLRSLGRKLPAHLDGLDLDEDVAQQAFLLLLRKRPGSFDPERGKALDYVMAVGRAARQDVMAMHAPPGERARPHRDADGMFHK